MSAAVYGASEGLSTLVVDRHGVGGQATSSSLIRNYLGFPRGISGRRLAEAAFDQAWVFGADFVFMQPVVGIERDGDRARRRPWPTAGRCGLGPSCSPRAPATGASACRPSRR